MILAISCAGRDLEAVRKARADAKRRVAYERTHFALVGRPAPTVIPYRTAKFDKLTPDPPAQGRVLRNLYISQVGRFQYRLIHRCVGVLQAGCRCQRRAAFCAVARLEGRWNGEATVIAPGHLPEVRVVSTELTFDAKEGRWHERQSLTDSTGLTSTQVRRAAGPPLCHAAPPLC